VPAGGPKHPPAELGAGCGPEVKCRCEPITTGNLDFRDIRAPFFLFDERAGTVNRLRSGFIDLGQSQMQVARLCSG
jgi:hypothetical protein